MSEVPQWADLLAANTNASLMCPLCRESRARVYAGTRFADKDIKGWLVCPKCGGFDAATLLHRWEGEGNTPLEGGHWLTLRGLEPRFQRRREKWAVWEQECLCCRDSSVAAALRAAGYDDSVAAAPFLGAWSDAGSLFQPVLRGESLPGVVSHWVRPDGTVVSPTYDRRPFVVGRGTLSWRRPVVICDSLETFLSRQIRSWSTTRRWENLLYLSASGVSAMHNWISSSARELVVLEGGPDAVRLAHNLSCRLRTDQGDVDWQEYAAAQLRAKGEAWLAATRLPRLTQARLRWLAEANHCVTHHGDAMVRGGCVYIDGYCVSDVVPRIVAVEQPRCRMSLSFRGQTREVCVNTRTVMIRGVDWLYATVLRIFGSIPRVRLRAITLWQLGLELGQPVSLPVAAKLPGRLRLDHLEISTHGVEERPAAVGECQFPALSEVPAGVRSALAEVPPRVVAAWLLWLDWTYRRLSGQAPTVLDCTDLSTSSLGYLWRCASSGSELRPAPRPTTGRWHRLAARSEAGWQLLADGAVVFPTCPYSKRQNRDLARLLVVPYLLSAVQGVSATDWWESVTGRQVAMPVWGTARKTAATVLERSLHGKTVFESTLDFAARPGLVRMRRDHRGLWLSVEEAAAITQSPDLALQCLRREFPEGFLRMQKVRGRYQVDSE